MPGKAGLRWPFRAFLEVAAQCNGELINYARIARDVGVDNKTVQSYFQILEDTLIAHIIEPYHRSVRKRQNQAPRFYLFDTGVVRAITKKLNHQPVYREVDASIDASMLNTKPSQ